MNTTQLTYSEQIAMTLNDVLLERGIKKKEFAKECNVQLSVVTRWLSGKHNFTLATLQVISKALLSDIITIN